MINFFVEDISFNLKNKAIIKAWIKDIVSHQGCKIEEINYIFCSDEYLLNVNREYLNHDYYTDIITFNNSDYTDTLESDIYISIDRIVDNARQLNLPFETELHRVLIHGILHLLGFKDKTAAEQEQMRAKENEAIEKIITMFHVKQISK